MYQSMDKAYLKQSGVSEADWEHAHARIKRYNAVSAVYRNHVTDFDDHLMLTATGL
jgi:hypothetical protein